MHTHAHTCTHAYSHVPRTHVCMIPSIEKCAFSLMLEFARTRLHTLTHAHKHATNSTPTLIATWMHAPRLTALSRHILHDPHHIPQPATFAPIPLATHHTPPSTLQLSDRFGRKACLFSAAIISAVCSAAGMACSSYWAWLVMRLLSGIGASGTSLCAYVLGTEAIGAKWRGAAGIGTQVFFIAGEFVLVLVSVLFSSWRGQAAAW